MNVLDEYMIRLGTSVDAAGLSRFHNALHEARQAVDSNMQSMVGAMLKTSTELVSGFAAIGGAAIGLADKVAIADQNYRLFAMHMYMQKDAARSLKITLDSLGEPMENLMWDPELRERSKQLIADQKAMATDMDFDAQMRKIRDVRFEFTRMEVEVKYLGMHVVTDFMKALGMGPDDLLKKLRQVNAWIIKHMPEISATIVKYFKPIWKDIVTIMKDVGHVFQDFATVFNNVVAMISGDKALQGVATFDKFAHSVSIVVDWLAKVTDFLVQITGLLSGALVGGTVGGLLGSIVGGVAGIPGGPAGIAAGILAGGATGTAIGTGAGAVVGGAFDIYRHYALDQSGLTGTPHMTNVPGVTEQSWRNLAGATGGAVSPELLSAVARSESGSLGMSATSSKGAVGYMQLMPDTAAQYGVDPRDPVDNLRGGTAYMRDLMKRYRGNEALALGAYNAGPGRMDAVLTSKATLPEETRNYIASTLAREGKSGSVQIGSVTIQITQKPGESQQELATRTATALRDVAGKQTQRNLAEFNAVSWSY